MLPFPKADGEVSNYSSITIPIIVQGETKYLNKNNLFRKKLNL